MSAPGGAFPHVVKSGESVAQIAELVYGHVELERVVVAANGLDDRRASAIVPGMRLELPAVGYHMVLPGETWQNIAEVRLGEAGRADVLAQVNDSKPWLPPAVGRELVVPYNLRYVAARGDTTESIAYHFLGKRDKAWMVAMYNRLERARLEQGQVILVPLTDLPLTAHGRHAAVMAGALVRGEGGGAARATQAYADHELVALSQDVRRGRYIEAVSRGAAVLALEGLSEPQKAEVHRQLTVAYVALEATGLAATSCARWRQLDGSAELDPIEHSPKILAACVGDVVESPDLSDVKGAASAQPADAGASSDAGVAP